MTPKRTRRETFERRAEGGQEGVKRGLRGGREGDKRESIRRYRISRLLAPPSRLILSRSVFRIWS
eukprot:986281-Pyramimonas_sp.AAC.1